MSEEKFNKFRIEEGDTLVFDYRLKADDEDVFKPNEEKKIIIGKDQFFKDLDKYLIGITTQNNGIVELQNLPLPEDFEYAPGKKATLGLKIRKHIKANTNEILEPRKKRFGRTTEIDADDMQSLLEKSNELNQALMKRIDEIEQEKAKIIYECQTKLENISSKAQEEVKKIKSELKAHHEEQSQDFKKYATQKLVEDLLSPLGNLHATVMFGLKQSDPVVQGYVKGFELIVTQIFNTLESHGVTPIEPKIGEVFNPEEHYVQQVVEDEKAPKDTILTVVFRGYKLNDRVVKPAIITVAG